MRLCLVGALSLCPVKPAPAQDIPAAVVQTVPAAPSAEASHERESEKKNKETAEVKKEKHHRGAILVAPLPIVSPAIGSGIIPVVSYIFPLQEKDRVSPPSVVVAVGLITNNGSRAFGLGAELFMKENKYELKSAYVRGNLRPLVPRAHGPAG